MTGEANTARSAEQSTGKVRFPLWLVAIWLGVPLVWIGLNGSLIGLAFTFLPTWPALLLVWALAGLCAALLRVHAALSWLVVIWLGVPLALIGLDASPLGPDFIYVMTGVPALLFVWAISGACAAILSVRAALGRAWRQSVIASTMGVAVLLGELDPSWFSYAGDVLHFIVLKPHYDRQIAALPADRKPRLKFFDWGGMVWASFGLLYDESDQVDLPAGSQSADWVEQASHELSCDGYGVRPLWGHYYFISLPC